MSTTAPKFKLALCQIAVGDDKQKNITTATAAVTEAAKNAAQVVSLPECWNSPYATTSFPQYAEEIPEKKAALNEKDHPMTLFDTPYGKMGVGICYDIRFPELSMLMKKQGAKILLFPGAFNLTTGPAHWELLQRARAVDNQLYVAATSPARGPEGGYQAWGHSTVISPWGEVVATCGHGESIVYAEVDLEKVEEMRRNIPTTNQTRSDLYELVQK
ncbi:hypothetical protein JG687_00008782 [Phytophthora cactorum]|uniref:CN hydrolase domain-containing protein n=1 Tax=Phytophthora cactorum TaxID=29920 RepID=A0A8T1UGK1_9STRA|nr:hypothetical protein JG687_00008782 [Phytophthora cactorum]